MAKSKEDIKYGTAQAKLSEDEVVRVGYKAGTPFEGGKIADSQTVDLFSTARNISNQKDMRVDQIATDRSHEPPTATKSSADTPPAVEE